MAALGSSSNACPERVALAPRPPEVLEVFVPGSSSVRSSDQLPPAQASRSLQRVNDGSSGVAQ
jgi:hypothetical protein